MRAPILLPWLVACGSEFDLSAADRPFPAPAPVADDEVAMEVEPEPDPDDPEPVDSGDEAISVVTVRVCVDGSDLLHLGGAAISWEHRNYEFPGGPQNCPGRPATVVDGEEWIPDWGDAGRTGSFGYDDRGATSDAYPVKDALFTRDVLLEVELRSGRGDVRVVQHPSSANGHEGVVLVDDDPQGGGADHEIVILATPTD